MQIDYRKDPDRATRYAVLDAATGRNLGAELPIFFADDTTGVLLAYKRERPHGGFVLDPETGEPITEEIRRAINIVLRA